MTSVQYKAAAADTPLPITWFPDGTPSAQIERETMTLRDIAARFRNTSAETKHRLPFIKLATFGTKRSDKNCLRWGENLKSCHGVEVEMDAGTTQPADVAATLEDAGLAAFIYTTPSHAPENPRWRALLPTAGPLGPVERREIVARLNRVLGGVLTRESFTDVQGFYFGRVRGKVKPETYLLDGDFADTLDAEPLHWKGKDPVDLGPAREAKDQSGNPVAVAAAREALVAAAKRVEQTEEARNFTLNLEAFHLGGHVACATLEAEEVVDALTAAAIANGYVDDWGKGDDREAVRVIEAGLAKGKQFPTPFTDADAFDDEPVDLDDLLGPPPDPASEPEDKPASFFTDLGGLLRSPAPAREWLVEGWLPHRTVHMMDGPGGAGKSLVALQLAMATAAARPWLDLTIARPGPVVLWTAEDEIEEVHRRAEEVAAGLEIAPEELDDRVHIRSAVGTDSIFATLGQDGKVLASALFKRLRKEVKRVRPSLMVLDTLANLHALDPNNQEQARAFVGQLIGLAQAAECTVLLLAHPSRTGMASGAGDGFSVGWANAVRSRSYFEKDTDSNGKAHPTLRKLTLHKANYGRTGESIYCEWRRGFFEAIGEAEQEEANRQGEATFWKLWERYDAQGRPLNPNSGANYLPKVFAQDPEANGVTKESFRSIMAGLQTRGLLAVESYGPPSRPTTRLVRGDGGFSDAA